MGEEFELKNVFIRCNDGTYKPIEKVEKVKLSDDTDVVYAHFPDTTGPIIIKLDMRRRNHRKMLKFWNKQANIYGRRVRYYKRQKERARRRVLKGARYQ